MFFFSLLQIRYQIFIIKNGRFKMVAAKMKNRDNIGENVG